ncbi:MAG: 3-isopropylmalate dehydrogenase [Treponema sp.]|jgi:3-isopropylmalate dehydrogenase|nr:3-isopropylmalate dehydrogenase [Treponema sp.]
MDCTIAIIAGDGVGPEVVAPAQKILETVGRSFHHHFKFRSFQAGGAAYDTYGETLPAGTVEAVRECDALLLGAVGGPAWDSLPGDKRPEHALLALRKELGVFANLRPAVLLPQLRGACPLKAFAVSGGFDILMVRELTSGIYFGRRGRSADLSAAFDTMSYNTDEIERILRVAYTAAEGRRKILTVVDKANVLETSRLWREVTERVKTEYRDVVTNFLYVDNAAMQLIRSPSQFDVIVTNNMFGDILSDESSVLTGSIGMLPSASLGKKSGRSFGIYEPVHGSAPDIAGQNKANPLGTILSAAMLLRHSLALEEEARAVEKAVEAVLDSGCRTLDLADSSTPQNKIMGSKEMGDAVLSAITSPEKPR